MEMFRLVRETEIKLAGDVRIWYAFRDIVHHTLLALPNQFVLDVAL